MTALPNEVRALLDGPNYAHLATVMSDGAPHVVAVWAGRENDHIVLYTGNPSSTKARNIQRDPRVSLSIVGHEDPYQRAHIRGRVVEARTVGALEAMDTLSVKYTGEPFPFRNPGGVLYVIEADRVGFSHLPFVHRPAQR
jgi:PPOX class probable F420-dependent enzyme